MNYPSQSRKSANRNRSPIRDVDFNHIKQAASGRWGEIIAALTPLSATVTERRSDDHPCSVCNGNTVIWPATRYGGVNQHGRIACRNCTDNKPTSDGIATIAAFSAMSQRDAAIAIARHLGIDPAPSNGDIVERVANAKQIPVEAFRRFGAKTDTRGRDRHEVARVPVYNQFGNNHSHFDLTPDDKGKFKRGEGNSGLFLPDAGRLPNAGEAWCVVEGVKDAAALVGLGYVNTCGLPGSAMDEKYATLFAGVDVVVIPDLDRAGQKGANKTCEHLSQTAASVKIARLPGDIEDKGGDDVRDIITRLGGAAVRRAVDEATHWEPSEQIDDRPVVVVGNTSGRTTDEVMGHLANLGWNDSKWIPIDKRERVKVYQRGGHLVEICEDVSNANMPFIRSIPQEQLNLRIPESCRLVTEWCDRHGDITEKDINPPAWLLKGIFSESNFGAIRRLEGVVSAPTIRPDGSVFQTPGWDETTGLAYRPQIEFEDVPQQPTPEDVGQAVETLLEPVRDFPLLDGADKSAWLALVLTLVGRPCIQGASPMFVVVANTRGAGKTLLGDLASIIAFGNTAARVTYPTDDSEMRKQITAIAIKGTPAVLLDNINGRLGGPSLDAALTADRWSDRELGKSNTVELPLKTVWIATGNNLTYAADTGRRVLPIRLDSPLENPEDRSDFTHPDIKRWATEHRDQLVVAALTILRSFFAQPTQGKATARWGSFESWSEIIPGAIVAAGLPDPLVTRETAKEDDQSDSVLRGFIAGLQEMDPNGDGLTSGEIVRRLDKNDEAYPSMRDVISDAIGKPDARRLGNLLGRVKNRVSNGHRINGRPGAGGTTRWRIETVSDSSESVSQHPEKNFDVLSQDTPATTHSSSPDEPKVESLDSLDSLCPDCGSEMTPAMEVNGWRNLDCPQCKRVEPRNVRATNNTIREGF